MDCPNWTWVSRSVIKINFWDPTLILTFTGLQVMMTRYDTYLSLWVVEISWHSNNCILNTGPQIWICRFLHFHQYKCSNQTGRVNLSITTTDPSISIFCFNNFVGQCFPEKISQYILIKIFFKCSINEIKECSIWFKVKWFIYKNKEWPLNLKIFSAWRCLKIWNIHFPIKKSDFFFLIENRQEDKTVYLHVFFNFRVNKLATDQPLCCIECVCRICDCLTLGWHSHQSFSI